MAEILCTARDCLHNDGNGCKLEQVFISGFIEIEGEVGKELFSVAKTACADYKPNGGVVRRLEVV